MLRQWMAMDEPDWARTAKVGRVLFEGQLDVARTGPALIERIEALL